MDPQPSVLVISVPQVDAELAADIVWQYGVAAVEERLVPAHWQGGSRVELRVAADPSLQQAIRTAGADRGWIESVEAVNPELLDVWRKHAEPIEIDTGLVIVPAWQAVPSGASEQRRILHIDPEGSFGMGDHPTTLLCARAIRETLSATGEWMSAAGNPPSALDVGCGSGVLALVACACGADPVRAIDISAAAVATTLRNAARNGESVVADTADLADVNERYDLVVANLLAPIIEELAADLVRVVSPSGYLVVSGLLDDQVNRCEEALLGNGGMEPRAVLHRQGWAAIILRSTAVP